MIAELAVSDTHPIMRLKDAPKIEVPPGLTVGTKWGGVGEPGTAVVTAALIQCHFRGHRQAHPPAADQVPGPVPLALS
jgi:hypothetical protein